VSMKYKLELGAYRNKRFIDGTTLTKEYADDNAAKGWKDQTVTDTLRYYHEVAYKLTDEDGRIVAENTV